MKRFLIFILVICFSLSIAGCAPFFGLALVDAAFGDDDEPSEQPEIFDYYETLENYLTEDQNNELEEIYFEYGIQLYMNQYWERDEYRIESQNILWPYFGEVIDTFYGALQLLGTDEKTISLVNLYVNSVCFNALMRIDGVDYDFYADSYIGGNYYISYTPDINSHEVAAYLMQALAYNSIIKKSNLDSFEFSTFNYNGFTYYDDDIKDSQDRYSEYLDNVFRYDYPKDIELLVEYYKAGLLSSLSTQSVSDDFASYIYQCTSPLHSLWWAYSVAEPIRSKADIALAFISSVNPAWNKEFFISISEPDNAEEILNSAPSNASYSYFVSGGVYKGYYINSSGRMNAVLYIDEINDLTSEITARFAFSPSSRNEEGKSGEYRLFGTLDFQTNEVNLKGVEWISKQPEGYSMLDISGKLLAKKLSGYFSRNYNSRIDLYRNEDEFKALYRH